MIINKKYLYVDLERVTSPDGTRYYVCPDTGAHLPSVTTILSATSDNTGLLEWRKWVGDEKANEIVTEACALGTLMHLHLENQILGIPRPRGSNIIRKQAENMANVIIENGHSKITEIWGLEIALSYKDKYAGTSDIIGLHENEEAIMDYKTSKKMKSKSQIPNYFQQSAAYAKAHNHLFGTNIKKVVIFMVSRDLEYKAFEVKGKEFDKAAADWDEAVEKFYSKNRETN